MSRHKSRFNFLRLAALAGFAGLAAMAQWPGNQTGEEPYIADGMLKFQMVEPGGNAVEQRSFAIVVARDRSGSLYRSQERSQGRLVTLWVKETGVLYSIDYALKTVEVLDRMDIHPGDPRVRTAAEASSQGAQKQVAGLACVPSPVFGRREGQRARIGEKCYATDPAGLLLSSNSEFALPGKTLREEMEITSVQRGVDPDASWFEVPGDFRVVKEQGR
jgi:hypothetical protein